MGMWTDQPSVRPTFLSGKVDKTIVIRKTRSIPSFINLVAETLSDQLSPASNSCECR